MRRILAIDTSGPILGLATTTDDTVTHRVEEHGPTRHVEHIVPTIERVLAREGWSARSLDGVAVAAGPGSFTGLRVGMAAAKAVALAADIPVISVGTLEALATTELFLRGPGAADLPVLVPMLDARKQRYYAAVFVVSRPEVTPTRRTPDGDLTLEELMTLIGTETKPGGRWCAPGPLAGDMLTRGAARAAADGVSAAPGVALIGGARLRTGATDDPYAGPTYLRAGDIGTRKSAPRFSPTTDGSGSRD